MPGSRGEGTAEALAATQHGVLTRRQAIEAGMSARTVARRVASGRWHPIHPGVYRPAAAPPTWRSEVMAAVLWAGPGAMASHRTAAALLELEGLREGPVEIAARIGRSRPGVAIHRLRPQDRPRTRRVDAIPVTAPDRTLLDLASVASPGVVGTALDDAVRRGLVTISQLRRLVEAEGRPGRRGTRSMRTLLEVRSLDRRAESELERRFLRVLRRAGLPHPALQHEVRSARGLIARLDFAYPDRRLGIETHGYLWHGGPERWRRDIRRENRLKRMGWTVLVFTWDDVVGDPGSVAGEVAAALASRALLPRTATGGARREKSSRRVAAALLALTACTGTAGPPSGERPPAPDGATSLTVIVSGSRAQADPYLAGMRLAIAEVAPTVPLRLSVADGDPAEGLVEALEDPDPAATLVIGPAALVAEQRTAIQADGRPVLVLGGDLYSSRSLFRQTFQTSIPAAWQARVAARYLARDRRYEDVLVAYPAGRQPERDAYLAALREEGLQPAEAPLDAAPPSADALADVDALAYLGPHEDVGPIVGALASLPEPPQLVVTNEALRTDVSLPPGTVAPGHYAWAPWADALPRVRDFRAKLDAVGPEQEGYDTIRVLADALERTGGRSGEPLIRALERNRPEGSTYSALPIVLGPDDHTLADETWVGLYAVPGPDEDREVPTTPWRPIIRTFTYDGERTIFREEDRTAFFPFWKPKRPSPYYFRSVLGIASRPEDPLH